MKEKNYVIQKTRELIGTISPVLNTYINFFIKKGKLPNLSKPKTFDEKISWLKLYDYPTNKLVIQCSDKVKVRDYVSEKGYDYILNKIYGTWKSPNDIDFKELPNSFVLKWNHDYNSTYVIKDKNTADFQEIVEELKYKGNRKFYLRASEMHYANIKPFIIAEQLLTQPGYEDLVDYKFYCFHGKVEYIMVCVGRQSNLKYYFFDPDWNFLRINNDGQTAPENFDFPRPRMLDKAIDIAEDLSEPFKFVRTDFYLFDDQIIFGELTFTPAAGADSSLSKELDKHLGSKIRMEV